MVDEQPTGPIPQPPDHAKRPFIDMSEHLQVVGSHLASQRIQLWRVAAVRWPAVTTKRCT